MSEKRFHGDQWFHKKVEARTKEALNQRNAQFAWEHRGASNEELLTYVRGEADRLGMTPSAVEIIGGAYIASRFGGWENAVAAAGLKASDREPLLTSCTIYKEEYKRQARLFKQERKANKEAVRAEHRAKNDAAIADLRSRTVRDMEWGEAHRDDTDEQLLDYVRGCAAENGCTPFERDVLGGVYIRERFGSWPAVLHFAGLPLRRGMKPVNPVTLKAYQKKRKTGEKPGRRPSE